MRALLNVIKWNKKTIQRRTNILTDIILKNMEISRVFKD